ncbi:MAG: 16S rRNA (cytosine(967)-C(5))-methyltransferase RsmB [Verrucomicrobiota bacterium]
MSPNSARGVALVALHEWRSGSAFAETIIRDLLERSGLSVHDRAFALELFYGILRNRTLLSFWMDSLRDGTLDDATQDILSIGLYQLFMLRTPAHAALYETVQLAPKRRRGLINGILRAAVRECDELETKAKDQPIAIRLSHPEFLIERWVEKFGQRTAIELCEWNNQPPRTYARINRLKIDPQVFFASFPEYQPLPGAPDFFEIKSVPNELIDQGFFYIQDPSTVTACQLLDPQAGETILDACAAPGGKTAILAQQMQNRGTLVACDRDSARIQRLSENLGRLDVSITHPVPCNWTEVASVMEFGPFDRILLDAPCSNTGVMRRRVDVRWRVTPADFNHMQNRQIAIATAVMPLLKAGGILVYSTCSLESEENEEAVARLLEEFPELKLLEQKSVLPFRDHFDGAFAAKLLKTR